jgi:phosphate transport system protein
VERHLDEELKRLKSELLRMAALTEAGIHIAIEALKEGDVEAAEQVIQDDNRIDDLEISNHEMIVELLALFQPMAKDLRFITTGMQINAELEEIADLTVNVSKRVKEIARLPPVKPLVNIPKLGEIAKWMVKTAIDSFVTWDERLAKRVILKDQDANGLRNTITHDLIYDYLVKDGTVAPRAIAILLIARDLERICDHAASIAEDVIYMSQAKMIRHHHERLLSIEQDESSAG